MGDKKLSVCVVAFNEERNIGRCLESVRWADEIIVVDSHSTDRTVEIARRYTDRVIAQTWLGYVAQKNFALEKATGEWVLCLDADEEVSPELAEEIRGIVRGGGAADGWSMPRRTRYLGRWIKHGGWYPDRKLRLIRKGRGRWGGADPHDKLIVDGRVERLRHPINHYNYRDFADQIQTIQKFSDVAVAGLPSCNRFACVLKMIFHPPVKFLECYVWKAGFLDGLPGFIIAVASSFYVFVKHVKRWERASSVDGGGAESKT